MLRFRGGDLSSLSGGAKAHAPIEVDAPKAVTAAKMRVSASELLEKRSR